MGCTVCLEFINNGVSITLVRFRDVHRFKQNESKALVYYVTYHWEAIPSSKNLVELLVVVIAFLYIIL